MSQCVPLHVANLEGLLEALFRIGSPLQLAEGHAQGDQHPRVVWPAPVRLLIVDQGIRWLLENLVELAKAVPGAITVCINCYKIFEN